MAWSLFKKHKSDDYFKEKFKEPMGREARIIVTEARRIRHRHPDLTGVQLVRLVYWGAPGEDE